MSFDRAMGWILQAECGDVEDCISDHPDDTGGLTRWGITTNTLARWNQQTGNGVQSVRDLTWEGAKEIYNKMYWLASKAPDLPWPLSIIHFDAWVQHSPVVASRILQKVVGTVQDGIIGPVTLDAAQNTDDPIPLYMHARLNYYVGLGNKTFLSWWVRRMLALWTLVGV